MSEQTEKKILSPEQAVQAACILFELNTREQDLLEMAQRGVPHNDDASASASPRMVRLRFTPPVVYGLMARSANQVMAEYLPEHRTLLSQMAGYTPERIKLHRRHVFQLYPADSPEPAEAIAPHCFTAAGRRRGPSKPYLKSRSRSFSGMMAITMRHPRQAGQYRFGVE